MDSPFFTFLFVCLFVVFFVVVVCLFVLFCLFVCLLPPALVHEHSVKVDSGISETVRALYDFSV